MGIMSIIRNRAAKGFPLVRRLAGSLLAPGRYEPMVTGTSTAGATVVLSPEVVEPKGILRSRSVVSALIAVGFGLADTFGWNLGLTEAQATQIYAIAEPVFAAAAAWFRIVAHMPTRG